MTAQISSRFLLALHLSLAPALGAVTLLGWPASVMAEAETSPLVVETAGGRHSYSVELARTTVERARGLMYRKSLPEDRGMLFDMERAGPTSFWMRNTFVSLDIIFIGADGRVLNVARATTPLSDDSVTSEGDARFVLELVAGQADSIGLKPGDRVRHPLIDAVAGG
ncbi:DUF192 domain-containing protein [Chthonobacter rhizosphaerae]|uniref:DUF192 domain-containing protein n=1 Tax=Chthonobacter rhizosphaerae TaxID=2735553 RepID=UPI0015EF62AF|nr:DUF192 domain-containing protein [Chthonobacter rhizosphaerae]